MKCPVLSLHSIMTNVVAAKRGKRSMGSGGSSTDKRKWGWGARYCCSLFLVLSAQVGQTA